ncbi:MAG: Ig-like domain-containing protein [Alphaproteobacteria bacterium]|nr:Ig-like domain-containing protein [Alphaproteobacteria bacterium]
MRLPSLALLTPALLAAAACTPDDVDDLPVDQSVGGLGDPGEVRDSDGALVYPAAADGPAWRGPGGPTVTFDEADLWQNCASLESDPGDVDHHNLVVTYRGHLVMPWAPEFGVFGGVSLFDLSDPCHPALVGKGTSNTMRETHAMGFVHLPDGDPHAGDWAVTNGLVGFNSGLQFWDLSDVANPVAVANLALEGSLYPDSYNLVTLSVFWQYPYAYAASANAGVFVVDATDPAAPSVIAHYRFDQGLRAGGVFALGNTLLVSSAEEEQAAILDISDPSDPQLVPGGLFTLFDSEGEPREAYHANRVGNLALFARKEASGGPIVYDISDPSNPTFVGDAPVPGSGGYVFYDEGYLFTGDSDAAHVFDATDLQDIRLLGTGDLDGDLDTLTPYGNVGILAVDDPGDDLPDGGASAVMPWHTEPDTRAPEVLAIDPPDGATGVALTGRIGIGFDEFIEPSSVFAGSIRLWTDDGTPVDGWGSAQEATASFTPKAPLTRGTTYTLEVVQGGVLDINGNAVATTTTTTFTTVQ